MSDNNQALKDAGLKVTLPRLKILEVLQQPACRSHRGDEKGGTHSTLYLSHHNVRLMLIGLVLKKRHRRYPLQVSRHFIVAGDTVRRALIYEV